MARRECSAAAWKDTHRPVLGELGNIGSTEAINPTGGEPAREATIDFAIGFGLGLFVALIAAMMISEFGVDQ